MNAKTTAFDRLRMLAARLDRFSLQQLNAPLTHRMLAGDR